MKILAIAQVETRKNLDKQIAKQTIQPDRVIYYEDNEPAQGIEARRIRIAENHQKLREIVNAYPEYDVIWQLEQDVDLPIDCLERLIKHYKNLDNESFGYVSGIQIGRHGIYCIGAWRDITDTSFHSIEHTLTGIQDVEATGFYCLLAKRSAWLQGNCYWHSEPYGPDVNWGLSMLKSKYVDMDLHIGHVVERGIIRPSHASTCTVYFEYNKEKNKWDYKTS